jgi:uncharacterized damage-inducible protein DinB
MFNEHNRPEPPKTAPPIEMISAFLDFQRATLLWKVSGLTDEQLRRPMVPSGTSLLALVKHSAAVETSWFQTKFAGLDAPNTYTPEDPDSDWRIEPDDTTEAIIASYIDACEKSRAIVRSASWDDPSKREGRPETLGWILCHMLEEISRHVGHADILREQIDGATGE